MDRVSTCFCSPQLSFETLLASLYQFALARCALLKKKGHENPWTIRAVPTVDLGFAKKEIFMRARFVRSSGILVYELYEVLLNDVNVRCKPHAIEK